MFKLRRVWFTLATIIAAGPTAADENGWAALREVGTVAIMRHALAPGVGDPGSFELGDCSTQRNLDARGREQARAIGAAFRANGIKVDRVLTSQWCRCRETAELLSIAPVEGLPALNSFFRNRSARDEQTAAVLAFIDELAPDERVVMVTHQVNISALVDRGTRSGEVLVLGHSDGIVDVRGSIMIAP